MALLKDQPISCLAEWMAYDTKLSILSEQEVTSIEAKSRLAQNEIETQVTSFLLRHSGLSENVARQATEKVVVTEALSRWHSMLTLSLFYIDLASLQNSALHRDQSRFFETKAEAAKDQLFDVGLGIVNQPLSKAPSPLLISGPGSGAQRILRGRIRFIDFDGAVGTPSPEFILDMSGGEAIELSVATLPSPAAGWLLYLGETSEPLYLSTPDAIAAGVTFIVTSDLPPLNGEVMNNQSQRPDRFIRYSTELWR